MRPLTYRSQESAQAALARIIARGLTLADQVRLLHGSRYLVPSATGHGSYVVDLAALTCPCPSYRRLNALDHLDHQALRPQPPVRCKHLVAAELAAKVFSSKAKGEGERA